VTVGELIERARFRAALAEAMRLASIVNQYVSEQAPWALIADDRERAGTVLNVVLRCIDDLKLLFLPFLPFSSQALHQLLGYDTLIAGELSFEEITVEEVPYTVLTGDYADWAGRWEPTALPAGQQLREPKPLYVKLDAERVVEEELERLRRKLDEEA
jgi:methionyl-tRNA synthetase